MNTQEQSQNKKTELESEISRLEALAEPTPEDVEKVEKLKDQLAEIQAIDLTVAESSGVHFRSLTEIELKRLAEFAARSPGFAKLKVEEKVDRLALAVTQGFGFGSFNANLLGQGAKAFSIPEDFPFENYLESSTYGSGDQKHKYSDVGQKSFKIDRLYLAELLGSGPEPQAQAEEPIRKKVQASHPSPQPVVSKAAVKAAPVRTAAAPKSQASVPAQKPKIQEGPKPLASKVEGSNVERAKKPWLIPAVAIGVVAVLSALFFVLA